MFGITDDDDSRPFSFKSGKFLTVHPRSDSDETPCFLLREKSGKTHKLSVEDFGERCFAKTA